jgi:hypothetical protein
MPRAGGPPRVVAYPKLDSTVWRSSSAAPVPSRVLAFDDEGGIVAYEDSRNRPVLLELRLGTITVPSNKKLNGFTSANGTSIFGITQAGEVVRATATGEWTYKPPKPAKTVYPQPDGAVLVSIGAGNDTRLLKLLPPDSKPVQEITFPVVSRAVRTQLGDRLYLAVDSGLAVLRTRTMDWAPAVRFKQPISVMAATPSGDRVFVLTDSGKKISIVDRFRDKVTADFELPAAAKDLRVDPFGRYLLARAADGDSIFVVAIGTERIIGVLRGSWRNDLPFVGYDGAVAVANGVDVLLYDGETLKQKGRVADGAQDYWYPFLWDGFRPRAASLDVPVRFDSVAVDTTGTDTVAFVDTTTGATTSTVADTTAPKGFVVSFAAFLAPDRARDLAGRIRVGGETARVVTAVRDGTTIYRVILGPFLTREEAERAGRDSGHSYWVYEGTP